MEELYTMTRRALKKIKWLESLEEPTYLNVDEAANAIRDYKRARRTAAKTTKAGRRHAGYAADIHERVTTGDNNPKGRRRKYFWQTKRWQDKAIGTGLAVGMAGAGLYATKGKKKKLFSRGEDGVIRLAKEVANDDIFDVARNPERHDWKISDTTPNTARVTSPHATRRRRKKLPEETMEHQREEAAKEKDKKGLWRAGAVTAATIGFIASRKKGALLKKAAKKLKKKGEKVKRVKRKAADALAKEQAASKAALAKQKKAGIAAHQGEIDKRVKAGMRKQGELDAAEARKKVVGLGEAIGYAARHPDRIELRHGGKRESNLARWDEPQHGRTVDAIDQYQRNKPREAAVGGAVGGVGTGVYTHNRMKAHAKVRDKILTKKGKKLTKKGVNKAASRRLTNVVGKTAVGAGVGAVGALLIGRALARRRENYG